MAKSRKLPGARSPTWSLPLDPTLIKLRDDEAVAYPKGWGRGARQLAIIFGGNHSELGGGGGARQLANLFGGNHSESGEFE